MRKIEINKFDCLQKALNQRDILWNSIRFPRINIHFPRIDIHFPRIDLQFPRINIHFPRINIHFPKVIWKNWDFYFKLCRFTVIQVKVHISNTWCNSSWNLFDKSLITSRRNFSCRLFLLSFIALATYVRKKLFRIDMVISPIWFRKPRIAHF